MTETGFYLSAMRATAPLVQNITNYVAMNVMANVLLAAGASPAMVHAREEAAEFAALAQALTVNIGTLDPDWVAAMEAAAAAMGRKPWVFDPVGAGATALLRDASTRLLALTPTIIRGNASEILALAALSSAAAAQTGKGSDAVDTVASAEGAARALALRIGAVVAVSGPVDYITDGARAAWVENGDAMMPRVTALGCSLNGVIGAFAVGQEPFAATVAALAYYGLAGEIAAQTRPQGPASFATAFVDALYRITPAELTARAKVRQ